MTILCQAGAGWPVRAERAHGHLIDIEQSERGLTVTAGKLAMPAQERMAVEFDNGSAITAVERVVTTFLERATMPKVMHGSTVRSAGTLP